MTTRNSVRIPLRAAALGFVDIDMEPRLSVRVSLNNFDNAVGIYSWRGDVPVSNSAPPHSIRMIDVDRLRKWRQSLTSELLGSLEDLVLFVLSVIDPRFQKSVRLKMPLLYLPERCSFAPSKKSLDFTRISQIQFSSSKWGRAPTMLLLITNTIIDAIAGLRVKNVAVDAVSCV